MEVGRGRLPDGKLWWIDHTQGIFCWDAFGDGDLTHIRLPDVGEGDAALGAVHDRYVKLSRGLFRCVNIRSRAGADTMVTVRTLEDPLMGVWSNIDFQFTFREIWDTHGYHVSLMPKQDARFAVMSPKNPDHLYFFVDLAHIHGAHTYHYGVDGRAKQMLGYNDDHRLVRNATSASVRAWVVPTAAGMNFLLCLIVSVACSASLTDV